MSKEKAILIGASIKVLDTLMATEKEKLLVVWPQVNVIFDKYSVSDLQQMMYVIYIIILYFIHAVASPLY